MPLHHLSWKIDRYCLSDVAQTLPIVEQHPCRVLHMRYSEAAQDRTARQNRSRQNSARMTNCGLRDESRLESVEPFSIAQDTYLFLGFNFRSIPTYYLFEILSQR